MESYSLDRFVTCFRHLWNVHNGSKFKGLKITLVVSEIIHFLSYIKCSIFFFFFFKH